MRHAQAELELLGVEPRIAATLVSAVGVVVSCQPSPQQFGAMVPMLTELLLGRPLSPLTANPAEWEERQVDGRPEWVNRRDERAVSADRGRSYTFVDDPKGGRHVSAPPRGWVLALRERDGMSESTAIAAVWEYLDAGGMSDADREMVDSLPPGSLRWDFMESRWGRLGGVVASLMFGDPVPGVGGVRLQPAA